MYISVYHLNGFICLPGLWVHEYSSLPTHFIKIYSHFNYPISWHTVEWMHRRISLSLLSGHDRWLSCPLQLCWKTVGVHRVFVKWSIYMCRMQSKGLCDSVFFSPPEIQLFEILYTFYLYFYEVNFWKEKDFFRNEWGNVFLFFWSQPRVPLQWDGRYLIWRKLKAKIRR